MEIRLYVPLGYIKWEAINAEFANRKFPVCIPKSGEGFLPVYNSIDKAKEEHPDKEIMHIVAYTTLPVITAKDFDEVVLP